MRHVTLLLLAIIFSFSLFSEGIRSVRQERLEILQFGIDNEVQALIDDLKSEKNADHLDTIAFQFERTKNIRLQQSILSYFEALETNAIEDSVLTLLYEDPPEESLVLALLSYVRAFKIMDIDGVLQMYLDDTRPSVRASAVKTVAELGLTSKTGVLREMFDDHDIPDTVQSEILLAFGKLKDLSSQDLLLDLLQDPDERRSNRWYASAALGELGTSEAYAAIKVVLNDSDTMLRTYAIRSIAKFDYPEVEQLLIEQGLRDSFWRVRLAAIEELESRRSQEAGAAIRFRARRDPEHRIRQRAIQAAGKIGGTENIEFLVELMLDERANPGLRATATVSLASDAFPVSQASLLELIDMEWEKDSSRLVEYIARELSTRSGQDMSGFYERFLRHNSMVIKVYAIRGIALNRLESLREKVEDMDSDTAHPSLRRAIVAMREDFGETEQADSE